MLGSDVSRSAVLARRIARIRIVAATALAIFMFAVSVGVVLLIRYSGPVVTILGAAEKFILLIAAISAAALFISVELILYRHSVGIAEAILWIDLVVLVVTAILFLATGSLAPALWTAAGFGFDLAKQFRNYRPSHRS